MCCRGDLLSSVPVSSSSSVTAKRFSLCHVSAAIRAALAFTLMSQLKRICSVTSDKAEEEEAAFPRAMTASCVSVTDPTSSGPALVPRRFLAVSAALTGPYWIRFQVAFIVAGITSAHLPQADRRRRGGLTRERVHSDLLPPPHGSSSLRRLHPRVRRRRSSGQNAGVSTAAPSLLLLSPPPLPLSVASSKDASSPPPQGSTVEAGGEGSAVGGGRGAPDSEAER